MNLSKFKKNNFNFFENNLNIRKTKKIGWYIVRTTLIIGISYIILFPLFSKFITSIMPRSHLWDPTVKWIPKEITLQYYEVVIQALNYPRALMNTFILSLLVTILQLFACMFVGYGLARFNFKGRSIVFGCVIFTLVVPPHMIMVPQYLNLRFFDIFGLLPDQGFNLLNTFWPLILMSATAIGLKNGLLIFLMRQFFKGFPKELEEAAYVDGAGPLQTFLKIMIPGATPAIITVFLFGFVWQWNDHFFASTYMSGMNILSINLQNLTSVVSEMGEFSIAGHISEEDASLVNNTGSLLLMAPLLIIYGFTQRYFLESIERTGLVG